MTTLNKKILLLLAIMLALLLALSGCIAKNSTSGQVLSIAPEQTVIPSHSFKSTEPSSINEEEVESLISTSTLSDTQINSINMLNYLVMLTQEIISANNNRLYLEEAYSTLYDNTAKDMIDERTQVEINHLFKTIHSFRMNAQKRDRIQYILEQSQAQAVRDAIPNPLGLISAVQSTNLSKLVTSVAYMALDSFTAYQTSSAQADMQYLRDGWELSDKESNDIENLRNGTFNYMVDTIRDYKLPGDFALSQEDFANFVIWKNKSNNKQVIQFFEDNVNIYKTFGSYWLALAERYYKEGLYEKCIESIRSYEELKIQIFKNDYPLARILPFAIISARKTQNVNEYIESAKRYAQTILKNTNSTSNKEWALRYFVAQTYIELYSLSNNEKYLTDAYSIVRNNVTILVDEQRKLNDEYMADVKQGEAVEEKGSTKAQKEDIRQYNKLLNETRKKELPPIHEPLLLNCELLFSLANQIDVSDADMNWVDDILHESGKPIFMVRPLDVLFELEATTGPESSELIITFDGSKITVPAQYITKDGSIEVTVIHEGKKENIGDWVIEKVERIEKSELSTFVATFTSKEAKSYKYEANSTIHIEIFPKVHSNSASISRSFKAVQGKTLLVFDKMEFVEIDI